MKFYKSITAVMLLIAITFSLTACNGNVGGNEGDTSSFASSQVASVDEDIDSSQLDITSDLPDVSFEDVSSLDDFKDKLESNGYSTVVDKHEDGTVVVSLTNTPTKGEESTQEIISTTTNPVLTGSSQKKTALTFL